MKRKYGIAMIVIALMMITPATVSAEAFEDGWGIYATDVYGFAIQEAIAGIGFRGETKELQLMLSPNPNAGTTMRGMAIIELLFNSSVRPQSFTAYLEINDTTLMTYDVLDMTINATIKDDIHYWMGGDGVYYDCTYLLAFVYLFDNKTIYNEIDYDLELQWFNDTWIGGPNDTLPVYSLASDNMVTSEDSNPVICIIGFDEITDEITEQSVLIIIIGTTSLIVMVIIFAWIYRRLKTD